MSILTIRIISVWKGILLLRRIAENPSGPVTEFASTLPMASVRSSLTSLQSIFTFLMTG